ncbi:MAG: dihydroorotate dehydrogenase electron transfer subunit [Nitrospirae bacterium]|nr:dihydroorotate dehydrogenase electron transfer subunit [Nitrospirota bacterium]
MKARVFSNSCLQGQYFKLIILPPVRLHILPGQFVMIRVTSSDTITDPLLSRPFSIHRQAMDGSIEILYKVVGKGTDLLTHLRKGDYIELLGPLGNGFPIGENKRDKNVPPILDNVDRRGFPTPQDGIADEPLMSRGLTKENENPPLSLRGGMGGVFSDETLIIAGGIGIAPMLCLIETIKSSNPETTIKVFLGGRGQEDLLCVEELKSLTSNIFLTTNDGSIGTKGYVTDALHEYLHKINSDGAHTRITVYACGPTPMLRKVLELTERQTIQCFTKGHENQQDKNVPPILIEMDRRGFLTPPEGFSDEHISIETYVSLESAMACGIGLCMGCVVKKKDNGYLLVCKDGPVFKGDEIELGT